MKATKVLIGAAALVGGAVLFGKVILQLAASQARPHVEHTEPVPGWREA